MTNTENTNVCMKFSVSDLVMMQFLLQAFQSKKSTRLRSRIHGDRIF